MSEITIDSNGILTSPDSHLGFSGVYISNDGGDNLTLNYTRHYGDDDGDQGSNMACEGIMFHGFTPTCFDVRYVDGNGGEDVLVDWHTDYDETAYETDWESLEPLSAELAYALCLTVEEFFDRA